MDKDTFKDKRVVITGGSGGIGTETARQYLDAGAKVLLVDIDEDALKKALEKLGGDNVSYYKADVSKPEEVKSYAKKAQEWMGGIDIFFNNAGVEGKVKPIVEYEEGEFDKVMSVNSTGMFYGLKYVMPIMKEDNGGSIVMTSSVAGLQGTAGMAAYTASKHAVIGLMRVAALEGAEMGIRVNTVHPAPVDNRMMRSLEKGFSPDDSEGVKSQFESMVPLGRYAKEEDVANLVLFLSSDKSAYITGGTYAIDGGMTA